MNQPDKTFEELMLDRGWIAVQTDDGVTAEWHDPDEPRNVWSDAEARLFYQAGDCGNVPYTLRSLGKVSNGQ